MFHKLLKLATGTALVNTSSNGPAYLRKTLVCRQHGTLLELQRFTTLHPRGVRGYYACLEGHIVVLQRDGVTRMTHQTGDRVYFAA